ncbi:MAG: hypothetical protein JRD00_01715 [Deltaproteobacteria bacterium]|nr:hypothetical protein [Deltaproteobacteria bacterium]
MLNKTENGRRGLTLTLVVLIALFSLGCAGEGSDLGENGGGLESTLSSIQENIFSPICAQPGCHRGPTAPEGLGLDSASESFDNLVSVPSRQQPVLFLVDPGIPDDSYMVWKIEGRAAIDGGQMPLNQPPLFDDEIEAIRQWILDGALTG